MPACEDNAQSCKVGFKLKRRNAAQELHFTWPEIMIFFFVAIGRMARGEDAVEHLDRSVCELEFRLLCFMSAVSLAISGTVIFLLV